MSDLLRETHIPSAGVGPSRLQGDIGDVPMRPADAIDAGAIIQPIPRCPSDASADEICVQRMSGHPHGEGPAGAAAAACDNARALWNFKPEPSLKPCPFWRLSS